MFKQEKGITLVSLVITIIVMLILAGVSLSMVMGDSSVLDQATQAVDETERSTVKDEMALAVGAVQTAYYGQYSNTTGRLTMEQCLTTKMNLNDFTSAKEVNLYNLGSGVYVLEYTHTNNNKYITKLKVSTTSITMGIEDPSAPSNFVNGKVSCIFRNGTATDTSIEPTVADYTSKTKTPVVKY